ncbi:hypothetical protein, partial [Nocardia brasiliensis]|uniref:hypothetical protein n=1 Tax=Nocardia brasiliensis TaxID=37326 RepID=UPI002454BAC1
MTLRDDRGATPEQLGGCHADGRTGSARPRLLGQDRRAGRDIAAAKAALTSLVGDGVTRRG